MRAVLDFVPKGQPLPHPHPKEREEEEGEGRPSLSVPRTSSSSSSHDQTFEPSPTHPRNHFQILQAQPRNWLLGGIEFIRKC